MQDFLRAAESQDIPVTDDLQDLVTGHGAEHWLKWISKAAYLTSILNGSADEALQTVTPAAAPTALMRTSTAPVPTTRTCTSSATPRSRSQCSPSVPLLACS